jgi:Leucine-rich repeat (LRR) protein
VTALTGLRRLHLINCSLGELPPGPYLSSLTELALTKNRVRALPAHLKQATALQALCLGDNYQLNLSDYISNDTMNALVKRSLRRVCYQSIQGTGPHGAVAVENAHSVAEYERYMRSMQALVRSHAKKIEVDVSRSLAENEWAHFVSKPDF